MKTETCTERSQKGQTPRKEKKCIQVLRESHNTAWGGGQNHSPTGAQESGTIGVQAQRDTQSPETAGGSLPLPRRGTHTLSQERGHHHYHPSMTPPRPRDSRERTARRGAKLTAPYPPAHTFILRQRLAKSPLPEPVDPGYPGDSLSLQADLYRRSVQDSQALLGLRVQACYPAELASPSAIPSLHSGGTNLSILPATPPLPGLLTHTPPPHLPATITGH